MGSNAESPSKGEEMIEYFEIEIGKRVEIGPAYSQDPRHTYILDDFVGLEGTITAIRADGFVRLTLDSAMPINIHAARLMEPQKSVWVALTSNGDCMWDRNDAFGRDFRRSLRLQCDMQAKPGDMCIIYSSTKKVLDKWIK